MTMLYRLDAAAADIARHFGARLSIDHGDVEARFRLPGGNPLTFILELWDESEAMWIRPEVLS